MRQRRRLILGAPGQTAHPLCRGLLGWWLALPRPCHASTWFGITRSLGGTHVNGVGWTANTRPGALGSCPTYTGASSQYTDLTALDAALNGLAGATLAFWARRAASGIVCVSRGSASNSRFGILHFSNNVIYTIAEPAGSAAYGYTDIALTGWNHYLMVFDGSQGTAADRIKLYLNGVLTNNAGVGNTLSAAPTTITTNTGLAVGRYGASGSYSTYQTGPSDDVAIWSRALTASEVWGWYDQSRRQHPETLRRSARHGLSAPGFKAAWARGSNVLISRGVA